VKEVALHTDGSCFINPGPGGWAAILVYGEHERELSGGDPETTNNRMELLAVIEGLRALKEPCRVTVYSDSQYVVKAFADDWIAGWKRRGWKNAKKEPVLNRELWEILIEEVERHQVEWVWVQGHAGDAYNERCHELAVAACQRYAGEA
jgi:ribonuclease HI